MLLESVVIRRSVKLLGRLLMPMVTLQKVPRLLRIGFMVLVMVRINIFDLSMEDW